MAIVRLGPIVQGASGSVGGVTLTTGRSTHTVRIRPRHRTSTSQAAIAARARVTTQMLAWAGLSDEDRAAWSNAAEQFTFTDALSQRRFLSPFQLFVKMRTFQTTFGAKPLIPQGPTTTSILTLALTTSVITFGITATITYQNAQTADILIYGRRSFHGYATQPRKPFRYISTTAAQPASVVLTADWVPIVGALRVGEYVQIEALLIADGLFPSFRFRAGTIVEV